MISDTLFDAVADINHYLAEGYGGEVCDEILLLVEQMNKLRSKLDQAPPWAPPPWAPPDPTEEELEQAEREFQNSPAGHFFGALQHVYFELKDLRHETELTDMTLENVDSLANDLKAAIEQARKHPVGIWLDWKDLSEEGLKTLNHGLEQYGLKFSAAEDTGDAWILRVEKIYEKAPQHEQEPKSTLQ
jgi:hypothetical protein